MPTSQRKWTIAFWVTLTVLPIIGVFASLFFPNFFFSSQEATRDWVLSFGVLAPLVIVLLQVVQVIFPPLSHYIVGFLSGFIFGPVWGAIYNWVGRMIGHNVVFILTKKYGRPFVEKRVDPSAIERFDKVTNHKSASWILLLIYFLPLLPDDEMSYISGLTKMKLRVFFWCNVFGHISGSMALAYLGAGVQDRGLGFWVFTAITLLGFPILYIISRKTK